MQFVINLFEQSAMLQESSLHFRVVDAPIERIEPLSLRNIDINKKSKGHLPAVLFGDYVRLQQVLANILRNALRNSQAMPVYIFSAYDYLKSRLVIQVADCGSGLNEVQLDEIRRVFTRTNTNTKQFED